MDDLVLFANDKTLLLSTRESIARWLADNRVLRLNPKHLSIEPTQTPAVLLGYRVSRAGISPSRKLRRRFRGKLRAAAAKGGGHLVPHDSVVSGLALVPLNRQDVRAQQMYIVKLDMLQIPYKYTNVTENVYLYNIKILALRARKIYGSMI
jgi:hypothetical protein